MALMEKQERAEWLQRRRKGIGGSDVAPILGVPAFKRTAYDVWLDKTGRADLESKENESMYFGNLFEDLIAEEFSKRTGIKCQRRNQMYRHPDHNELLANLDRKIVGRKAILECKNICEWADNEEWGESGTDDIPEKYLCQTTHYMSVTGYHEAFLAAFIGGNRFRWYHIPYSKDLGGLIKAKCLEFWKNHVLTDDPPPPSNLADIEKLYAFSTKGVCATATEEVKNKAFELAEVKGQIKELEGTKKELEFDIKSFMKDAATLIDPLELTPLASSTNIKTNKLNNKLVKDNHPDIYKECCKESGYRRFLLKV